MMKYLSLLLLLLVLFFNGEITQSQQLPGGISTGGLQQNIYQFIKANQQTNRFGQILDQIAQQSNDQSVVQALNGQTSSSSMSSQGGFTVFVPVNDALQQLPNDVNQLRNDIYNLIVRQLFTLDTIRQRNGSALTNTFGFRPNLILRSTKNFYMNQYRQGSGGNAMQNKVYQQQGPASSMYNNQQFTTPRLPSAGKRKRRQAYTTRSPFPVQTQFPGQPFNQFSTQYPGQTQYPNQFPGAQFSTQYPGQMMTTSMYRQDFPGMFPNNQSSYFPQSPQNPQNPFQPQDDRSVYDQYSQMAGAMAYQGPPISSKLPKDELFLLNSAIILDKFDLTNGVVYLINAYPRYYEKSLLGLLNDGDVNGLASNLNFWITRAAQSFRVGDENLRNALNAYGPNTYFLPTDQAMNKFTNREQLNNASFLFDILFKSHRVSNQLLFDYYLDDPTINYYTDGGLPVSTMHRFINGRDDIDVSIGHVKGKILPEYRNIYCASGVIHLIDTVLGVPSKSAYQEISQIQTLSTFRSIIDRSSTYRTLLDQMPPQIFTTKPYYPRQMRDKTNMPNTSNETSTKTLQREKRQFTSTTNMYGGSQQQQQQFITNQPYQQQYGGNARFLTVLAPNDFALIGIKDDLMMNQTALEAFLSAHIIPDRVIYTDHDDVIFQNGQSYSTMNPMYSLTAQVQPDPTGVANIVRLQVASASGVVATIVDGNDRVSNGVIHIINKPLLQDGNVDINAILNSNNPGTPAFSQFVDALRSTGIFNDLSQPSKKYTLFIPTNEALASYQDIMNSNDIDRKRKLIYRHICLDQNLQSSYLSTTGQQSPYQGMTTQQPINQYNPSSQYPSQFGGQQSQLICRNALGQDLTLTRDAYGLVSQYSGMAQSKVLNDFPGTFSSAYVLERPLLNQNLPNYGLNNVNKAASSFDFNFNLILFISLVCVFIF